MKAFRKPLAVFSSNYVAPLYPGGASIPQQLLGRIPGVATLLNSTPTEAQLTPVSLRKAQETPWVLPIDPILSVQGRHHIVRRQPLHGNQKGSIKERWGEEDHQVVLQGYFVGAQHYPEDEIARLHGYFTHNGPIGIITPVLQALGLRTFSIIRLTFPPTEGRLNQRYTLEAYSDQMDYQWFEDA